MKYVTAGRCIITVLRTIPYGVNLGEKCCGGWERLALASEAEFLYIAVL